MGESFSFIIQFVKQTVLFKFSIPFHVCLGSSGLCRNLTASPKLRGTGIQWFVLLPCPLGSRTPLRTERLGQGGNLEGKVEKHPGLVFAAAAYTSNRASGSGVAREEGGRRSGTGWRVSSARRATRRKRQALGMTRPGQQAQRGKLDGLFAESRGLYLFHS